MDTERLRHDFDYHAPDAEKVKKHEALRYCLRLAAEDIDKTVPDCREKSLAITKVEEAMFWANAALAREPRPESKRGQPR